MANTKLIRPERKRERIQGIAAINQELLRNYFPQLNAIKDSHYVTMATWGLESNFELLRGGSSRHYTAVSPTSIFSRAYRNSAGYKSFSARADITPTEKYNLDDGIYAQGLTATMGSYYIRDNRIAKDIAHYEQLMSRFEAKEGLPTRVNYGQSFSELFTAPGRTQEQAWKISLFQGLIIFDWHLSNARKKISDPSIALMTAVATYVGLGKDSNGYSGFQRVYDVRNNNNPQVKSLLANGIAPSDSNTMFLVGSNIVAQRSTRSIRSGGSGNSSTSNSNTTVAQTNSTSRLPSEVC